MRDAATVGPAASDEVLFRGRGRLFPYTLNTEQIGYFRRLLWLIRFPRGGGLADIFYSARILLCVIFFANPALFPSGFSVSISRKSLSFDPFVIVRANTPSTTARKYLFRPENEGQLAVLNNQK